jgi:hypothetical protein
VQREELTRVYIALSLAQHATRRLCEEQPENDSLNGVATTLDVTTCLLEDILRQIFPAAISTETQISHHDIVM